MRAAAECLHGGCVTRIRGPKKNWREYKKNTRSRYLAQKKIEKKPFAFSFSSYPPFSVVRNDGESAGVPRNTLLVRRAGKGLRSVAHVSSASPKMTSPDDERSAFLQGIMFPVKVAKNGYNIPGRAWRASFVCILQENYWDPLQAHIEIFKIYESVSRRFFSVCVYVWYSLL